ncbi:FHA domain protein containing protein [Raphidiopsis brookii D9]|nr:FHA domain protein containing protein [Raphidiopsis brookii D9]
MNRKLIKMKKSLFKLYLSLTRWVTILAIAFYASACTDKVGGQDVVIKPEKPPIEIPQKPRQFSEVSPPQVIQELESDLEPYQPQVSIVNPILDQVIEENSVAVRFQVRDLPIFKHPQLQLGPHLHVILDNQPYIPVYDLNIPLVLKDLSAGTHTLRVFASRPWHESFKNEGAYAQTTFHVLTKSSDNNPDPNLPLLTYSRPNGNYGAEPIMLDFYLGNAPLHTGAQENLEGEESNVGSNIGNWRIRCTINGESFVLDNWETIYLKGFKPGKNWVELEFLDNEGNPVKNVFNSTVRMIDYQPGGQDTLSKIVRGEVTAQEVRGIVDPNYVETPTSKPSSVTKSEIEVIPTPETVEGKLEPTLPTPPTESLSTPETVEGKLEPTPPPHQPSHYQLRKR